MHFYFTLQEFLTIIALNQILLGAKIAGNAAKLPLQLPQEEWQYSPKCTLPIIFCVPTPLAMPAHRRSTSLIMLHLSAQAWLMMVIWAPTSNRIHVKSWQSSQIKILSWKGLRSCTQQPGNQPAYIRQLHQGMKASCESHWVELTVYTQISTDSKVRITVELE